VHSYISNHEFVLDKYNDSKPVDINPEHMDFLLNEVKCDARLSHHIASIFVRDPIPSFSVEMKNTPCQMDTSDDERQVMDELSEIIGFCPVSAEGKLHPGESSHACQKCKWWMKTPPYDGNNNFENIQSTNWNSLRFKIPPSMDTDIGWRVEFRPMDICVTDFENSALTIMVGMLANLINEFDLDFIIPVTLIDENMRRAHMRDALTG